MDIPITIPADVAYGSEYTLTVTLSGAPGGDQQRTIILRAARQLYLPQIWR